MYVDAAYCYRPSSVVCRSVTLVSPAETAAPIEMPFGLRTRVGSRNDVLDRCPDPPWEGANLRGGKGHPIVKHRDSLRSSVQKRLNLNRCRLGCGLGSCVRWGSSSAKGRCHGNQFWDAICYNWLLGYNFGCIIASDTLFSF